MPGHPSEGTPPPISPGPEPEPEGGEDDALRAELVALKRGQLNKRARDAGIDADAIDEIWDETDDQDAAKAAVVERTIKALRAAEASGAALVRTSTRDALKEMEKKYQEMLQQKSAPAGADQGAWNIKQRLDDGAEWKAFENPPSNWWQTDMAAKVNRLRAAARIRESLPDETRKDIPDLYPQLVVLGDGNTGKSTVLNRFAEFAFSAISDGVCTRRPVRLRLRPVQATNRARMQQEKLLAICKMEDTEDSYEQPFDFRTAHREADEDALRRAVETRASKAAVQDGTAAAFDDQYLMSELIITIEADQMIYFDLLDLPGLDNASPKPKRMVERYINKTTLSQTFVLIFADHKKGDTQLMHSLAFAEMQKINEDLGDKPAWERFIDERCLGVITKVDKELEGNTVKSATDYDTDAATKLRKSLLCEEHPPHLDKWPWVAVLNPNPEEQLQNMSFVEACKKETWFFDTLFAGDEDTRQLCGVGNFRSKLVDMYEHFVAAQIKEAAPKVFAKVSTYGQHMTDQWAWKADQECYEDKEEMMRQQKDLIKEMVNIGKDTSEPMTVVEILLRKDVQDCIDRCRHQIDPDAALKTSKLDLLKLMATVSAKLIEQVHTASQRTKYRRFVTMGEHMVKVMVFIVRQFLDQAEAKFDEVIKKEEERYQATDRERIPVPEMVNSLVSCAKSELSQLARMVEDLPSLPGHCFLMGPDTPDFLDHAKPQTVAIEPPFAFTCDESGMVTTDGTIPRGSTIIQINGRKFTQSAMLEWTTHSVVVTNLTSEPKPMHFTYALPGLSVITDDRDVTKWMYHHEHVSREYLEKRERFLCHRRAAEILVLVFNAETVGDPARTEFEGMQGTRQLLCLDPGGDPDWYSRYFGERPELPRDASPQTEMGFQIELPGVCCTKGCTQTHDTAFNPCGHTVCCWECAQTLDQCPVCRIDLTCDTGIRDPKHLCYDYPVAEKDHQKRVRDAKARDEKAYQDAKDGYNRFFVAFKVPEHDATAAWAALERHRQALLLKPERLEEQLKLWPTFADLANERELCERKVALAQQQAQTAIADEKARCARELAHEKQRAATELIQEKQRAAAASLQADTAFDQERRRAATELTQEKQHAATALAGAKRSAERKLAAQTSASRADGAAQMLKYAKHLEVIITSRDARVRKVSRVDDASRTQCQAPACTTAFKPIGDVFGISRHHCRACGDVFCNECCPGDGHGFTFETANGAKNKRVCELCRAALVASGGIKSRMVEPRPDGTEFGS